MGTPTAFTWVCATCGRNVPQRVPRCHCGATREQAQSAPVAGEPAPTAETLLGSPAWRGVWRTLPRDVRAMVIAVAVLVLGGTAWLLVSPPVSNNGPALLGRIEPPPPPPPKQPAFKLPWWK
jgi:hypothetical protein